MYKTLQPGKNRRNFASEKRHAAVKRSLTMLALFAL